MALLRSDPEAHLIQLDAAAAAIERALPLVSEGLGKYCRIQNALKTTDVAHHPEFQRSFNGFYRIRRDTTWRRSFYSLLEDQKSSRRSFAAVLEALRTATGRVEASFVSKLVASVDPDQPVIDFFVLKNLGLRLSSAGTVEARVARIVDVHAQIGLAFSEYLKTDMGTYLTKRFEEIYPDRHLTRIKMLDLTLWQIR